MTTAMRRFQCPTCGALLREDATLGAVRCEFCGRRSALAEGSVVAPRLRLMPTIDRSEAVLALRREAIGTGVLPRSLRAQLAPVDLRLVYVPFHAARGIVLGTIERAPEGDIDWVETTDDQGHVVSRRMVRREPIGEPQAKVVASDAERIAPAVRRKEWGLEAIQVGAMLGRGAVLVPHDPDDVRPDASTLAADVPVEEALAWLSRPPEAGTTSLVAPSVRTVLVPVWRIRYRIRGCLYDATLDAVEGRLLSARAPEDDRHRVPIALAYAGTASLALGFVLRGLRWLAFSGQGIQAWLFVAIVFLTLLALFGTYAWNVVRYDAERVWIGGRVWPEYLNKPPSTGLERFWERVFGGIADATDPTRER